VLTQPDKDKKYLRQLDFSSMTPPTVSAMWLRLDNSRINCCHA
jgi:hypothetical protein